MTIKRSECKCECHSNPLISHFVPCCESDLQCSCIANCNEIASVSEGCRGLRKLGVHEYRASIADDCTVGSCSMNKCVYPHCSASARVLISLRCMQAEDEGRVMDGKPGSPMQGITNWEPKTAQQIREDVRAALNDTAKAPTGDYVPAMPLDRFKL